MDTTQDTQERFQAYYIDYLLNHSTVASYAAAHNLTYETAKHRLDVGRKAYEASTAQPYSEFDSFEELFEQAEGRIDYKIEHAKIECTEAIVRHMEQMEVNKTRLDASRKAYEAITAQTYSDTLAATGLAFF